MQKSPNNLRWTLGFPYLLLLMPFVLKLSNHPALKTSMSLPALISIVIALWMLVRLLTTKSEDPYGLFHLELNKLPGAHPGTPPKTEWLNMGYWKVSLSKSSRLFINWSVGYGYISPSL